MIAPMILARTLALAALAAALPALAQERPTLTIGSPSFQPLPIAVAQFQGEGSDARAAGVTEVVRGDLGLSGLFDVLDPRGFLADPSEGWAAPTIRFARWSDVGAEGLVKARMRQVGDELEAELHLYEVRAGREVLVKRLSAAASDPRALGHRISDEIVRYYTREPGVFSTKLVAIRKLRGHWELVMFDVDGKNPRVLLSERTILLAPSWRPDGRAVLLTSYRSGRPELWLYTLADRGFRRLAAIPNAYGGVYSPDGTRIAFTITDRANSDVWLMNADGTGAKRLTREPALDLSPSWSPDGARLAFVSDRSGTPQIYLMGADGSSPRRLTFQGNYNQTPAWSPRGDAIAFTARDERKVFDVFVVSPENGKIQRVTQDQGRTNEEPTWAPNGRLMALKTDRAGASFQVVVSDARGEKQTVVTGGGGGELSAPAWGPLVE
jgi:TolB protein